MQCFKGNVLQKRKIQLNITYSHICLLLGAYVSYLYYSIITYINPGSALGSLISSDLTMYNVASFIEPPPTYQIGPTFSIGLKILSFTMRPVKNEKNETSLVATARNTSNQNVCIQKRLCLWLCWLNHFLREHRLICKLVSSHISC